VSSLSASSSRASQAASDSGAPSNAVETGPAIGLEAAPFPFSRDFMLFDLGNCVVSLRMSLEFAFVVMRSLSLSLSFSFSFELFLLRFLALAHVSLHNCNLQYCFFIVL
jgi:hypothetical protein